MQFWHPILRRGFAQQKDYGIADMRKTAQKPTAFSLDMRRATSEGPWRNTHAELFP